MSSLVELEIKAICFIVQCILVLKHGIECMKKAVIIVHVYIYMSCRQPLVFLRAFKHMLLLFLFPSYCEREIVVSTHFI